MKELFADLIVDKSADEIATILNTEGKKMKQFLRFLLSSQQISSFRRSQGTDKKKNKFVEAGTVAFSPETINELEKRIDEWAAEKVSSSFSLHLCS